MLVAYKNIFLLDQLKRSFRAGKLHHANLISSGIGGEGLPIAIELSKMLLCEKQTGCGKCRGCVRVSRLEHPDLNLTFPIVSGGTSGTSDDYIAPFRALLVKNLFLDPSTWQREIASKNQQLQIPVKEIQRLHKKLSLTPAEGKNRVLLLWMPESIKTAASNKLLKLIEEPLENTYIILVTHNKKRLLPTILSRCAPWQCKPFNEADFVSYFPNETKETKAVLSMLFAPNLGAAIAANDDLNNNQAIAFAQWMRACYKGSPKEITDVVNELSSLPKEGLKTLISSSLHLLERGFYHNVQGTHASVTELGAINLKRLSGAVVPSGAYLITKALSSCLKDIERNIHVKTSLSVTSYQLNTAFKGM
jgi:DNA polymerase-3 subunit delta'